METDALRRFFNLADATGLALPEDSQELRAQLQRVCSEEYRDAVHEGLEDFGRHKVSGLSWDSAALRSAHATTRLVASIVAGHILRGRVCFGEVGRN